MMIGAQTSVVSLFLIAEPVDLVGSIAGSDSTATTYVVECVSTAAAVASSFATNPTDIDTPNPAGFDSASPTHVENYIINSAIATNSAYASPAGIDNSNDFATKIPYLPYRPCPTPLTFTQSPATAEYGFGFSNSVFGTK
ncbi:hypothetical protein ABVK25_010712 [Lepraria finkii]|uniref:Uncharacterized protein n=1 Tax=Lepraria finkii TaxID=1340010 RepID=A0ABR4AW40_9LECA